MPILLHLSFLHQESAIICTFQMMRSSNIGKAKAYCAIYGCPKWDKRDYATPWQTYTLNGHFPIAFHP